MASKQLTMENDPNFVTLFAGKFDVSRGSETWDNIWKFMTEGSRSDIEYKFATCMIFAEKPVLFLLDSVYKNSSKPTRPVKEKLRDYLPLHTEEQMKELEKESKLADWRKRPDLAHWRRINFTQVRLISLLYAEFFPTRELTRQWLTRYGGSPSNTDGKVINKLDNEETISIRRDLLLKFKQDKNIWSEYRWNSLGLAFS